jgi:hypothetical protein
MLAELRLRKESGKGYTLETDSIRQPTASPRADDPPRLSARRPVVKRRSYDSVSDLVFPASSIRTRLSM